MMKPRWISDTVSKPLHDAEGKTEAPREGIKLPFGLRLLQAPVPARLAAWHWDIS